MWYQPDSLLEIKPFTTGDWLWFAAANVAFILFMITIAPRLRAFVRGWRRQEDQAAQRMSDYYGAQGGPAVVPRNLVPELCVGIYLYLGAVSLWLLVRPLVATLFFALALTTLAIWKGSRLVVSIRAASERRRQVHEASEYIADQAEQTP